MEDKSSKGTKKCVVAESLTFDGRKIYRDQTLFENKKHKVSKVSKHQMAFNRNDDKSVQADGTTVLDTGYLA